MSSDSNDYEMEDDDMAQDSDISDEKVLILKFNQSSKVSMQYPRTDPPDEYSNPLGVLIQPKHIAPYDKDDTMLGMTMFRTVLKDGGKTQSLWLRLQGNDVDGKNINPTKYYCVPLSEIDIGMCLFLHFDVFFLHHRCVLFVSNTWLLLYAL